MPGTVSGRLTLGRDQRLLHGGQFARVKASGGRLVRGCLILNWLQTESDGPARLGVITSKRIGNAVKRNRARRLMREAYRLHQFELAHSVDLVLVARQSINEKEFVDVERVYLKLLREANLLKPDETVIGQ